MTIYNKVLIYCKDHNMTIAEFERMCGLGNATVRSWGKGRCDLKVSTLKQIALATGIPVASWLEEAA